jgi:hypothetical protein
MGMNQRCDAVHSDNLLWPKCTLISREAPQTGTLSACIQMVLGSYSARDNNCLDDVCVFIEISGELHGPRLKLFAFIIVAHSSRFSIYNQSFHEVINFTVLPSLKELQIRTISVLKMETNFSFETSVAAKGISLIPRNYHGAFRSSR